MQIFTKKSGELNMCLHPSLAMGTHRYLRKPSTLGRGPGGPWETEVRASKYSQNVGLALASFEGLHSLPNALELQKEKV